MHPTAESDSAVCCTPRSQDPRFASLHGVKLRGVHPTAESEYLGKIETEFENILACLSGAQMGWYHEKTGRRKSRDTLPLNYLIAYLKGVCLKILDLQFFS